MTMLPTWSESRLAVATAMYGAFSRPEIEAAQALLREHLARFPFDTAADIDHLFPYFVEELRQREEQARSMGLTKEEIAEREAFFKEILDSGDPLNNPLDALRVREYRDRLQAWLERFPDDLYAQGRLQSVLGDLKAAALLDEIRRETEPVLTGV